MLLQCTAIAIFYIFIPSYVTRRHQTHSRFWLSELTGIILFYWSIRNIKYNTKNKQIWHKKYGKKKNHNKTAQTDSFYFIEDSDMTFI